MNFLGLFEIERKTDVLALTAFLLSALSAFYQFGILVFGPKATLIPPAAVTLYRFGGEKVPAYASVATSMSVAHTSNATEPLLVKMETATFALGKKTINLMWHGQPESPIADGETKFGKMNAIGPFIVDTKKIQSSLVVFAPQSKECGTDKTCDVNENFLSWNAFIDLLRDAMQKGETQLTVQFAAEFTNHRTVSVSCVIPLHPNQLHLLATDNYVTERCALEPS